MTVLRPWPLAGRPQLAAPMLAGVPVQPATAAFPPCTPRPLGLVGHRLPDWSALAKVRPAVVRQVLSLRAGMAELVLLNRLRARTRPQPGQDVLERAARILEVTSRHWFGAEAAAPSQA